MTTATVEETKTYNGWANYETWAVALWIDNEESLYRERQARAETIWKDAEADKHFTKSERARLDLADDLKTWVEELRPENPASIFEDLLSAALGEVDWLEMADNWLSELEGYEPRMKNIEATQTAMTTGSCPTCEGVLLYDDTTDTLYCGTNPDHHRVQPAWVFAPGTLVRLHFVAGTPAFGTLKKISRRDDGSPRAIEIRELRDLPGQDKDRSPSGVSVQWYARDVRMIEIVR